ncbi:hypothetical protein MRX96_055482 [Rhipicephalus microplus]
MPSGSSSSTPRPSVVIAASRLASVSEIRWLLRRCRVAALAADPFVQFETRESGGRRDSTGRERKLVPTRRERRRRASWQRVAAPKGKVRSPLRLFALPIRLGPCCSSGPLRVTCRGSAYQ